VSTVTELNPRLLAISETGVSVWPDQIRRSLAKGGETLRSQGLPVERVEVEGNPADAIRALTDRIKAILERS
jgi:hypothetical protein